MKIKIISLLTLLLLGITSSFADTHATSTEEQTVVCGNGKTVVEMSSTAPKSHLSLSFKNIYHMFDLSMINAVMQSRTEDIKMGEIVEKYIVQSGEFTQHTFVSRKDDISVIYLSSDKGSLDMSIKATPASLKGKKGAPQIKTHIKAADTYIQVQNTFPKLISYGDTLLAGNEAVVRVFSNNNKTSLSGEEIKLKGATEAILIIASKQLTSLVDSHYDELNGKISDLLNQCGISTADKKNKHLPKQIYDVLFKRHYDVHQVESKAISFTLHTSSQVDKSISEMYNKMFYKGLCYGNTQTIETNNFAALPKLSPLVKSEIQASFLFDYYLYTLDTEYLEKTVLPLMLKVREDVEKTLKTKDSFGYYVISKDNPTMEVTAHIFFYRDLISTCNILSNNMDEHMSFYQELIPQCEKVLSLLPPYQIDRNEEFRRNLVGEALNNQELPDVPQLLGLFYRNDPIIYRNYDIREACRTTIKTCIDYRKKQNMNGLDAGFVQLALSSAALGDGDTAYNLIFNSKPYWTEQSGHEIVPILTKMLVQSYYSPESNRCYVNILPATPDYWPKGELKGAPVRGGITLKSVEWDSSQGINTTVESKTDITLDIYIHGKFVKKVELQAGVPHSFTAPYSKDKQ